MKVLRRVRRKNAVVLPLFLTCFFVNSFADLRTTCGFEYINYNSAWNLNYLHRTGNFILLHTVKKYAACDDTITTFNLSLNHKYRQPDNIFIL